MKLSGSGREGVVGLCPSVCARIVSLGGVKINAVVTTTPDDHFAAGPHGRLTASGRGRVGACPSPTVVGAGRRWRHAVSPTGVQRAALISSAPDDHFIASPHCCGNGSAGRRAGSADGCPTVGNGIISSTGVQIGKAAVISTPDDHFAAGPHCRVTGSAIEAEAGGCPTVGNGIISPAAVQMAEPVTISAPDDHFAASPHCRVIRSGSRRIGEAGRTPSVVRAGIGRIRYHRKRVVGAYCRHCHRRLRFRSRSSGGLGPAFAFGQMRCCQ